MSWGVVATRALLMVAVGLSFEVIFTAFTDLPKAKDWKLQGYTYVWMIPIYLLLYPLFSVLLPRLAGTPWGLRGLLYTGLIFVVEYVSGFALRRIAGLCPWEANYRKGKWHVHGLIRLDFAPAWFCASLLYEWVYRVLTGA